MNVEGNFRPTSKRHLDLSPREKQKKLLANSGEKNQPLLAIKSMTFLEALAAAKGTDIAECSHDFEKAVFSNSEICAGEV